ncbi:hypothetical protein ACFQ08_35155 [Streptosporangium algeriense]|uniref:Uncharacterized protein n=1 Tax=Streptosporangium algeriense TaxID=1682748 RepID=A0ABW3E4J9_9ACTN
MRIASLPNSRMPLEAGIEGAHWLVFEEAERGNRRERRRGLRSVSGCGENVQGGGLAGLGLR